MEWRRRPEKFNSVEDAIIAISGQSRESLINPRKVPASRVAGLQDAAEAIFHFAISKHGERRPVHIVGDYDADGITSTAILTKLLNYFGVIPKTTIPKRFTDGYGVSESILAGDENALIITVDNGISAGSVLDDAVSQHGNAVIVIDHHLLSGLEPMLADVVIDPHIDPASNGFVDYCGAGLAYKLSEYMLAGKDVPAKLKNDILALACIGTLADAMPLVGDNRRIVIDGLMLMNDADAKFSCGISRLLYMGSSGEQNISADTISYKIAPLINAPGRLYNAGGTSVLKMLLCDNNDDAAMFANKMHDINENRKQLVGKWMESLKKQIEGISEGVRSPLILYAPGMPEGLVGLVAGRLADTYHAVTIILVDGAEEGLLKGSARSYGTSNVKEMLDSMSDIFSSFGGHAGAAGLSLPKARLEEFRERAAKLAQDANVTGEYIQYDVELSPLDVSDAMRTIKQFQPLGQGVPNPVCKICKFNATGTFTMGKTKSDIKFNSDYFSAVAFGLAAKYEEIGKPTTMDLVGTLGENTYMGRTTIQLMTSDFAAHP